MAAPARRPDTPRPHRATTPIAPRGTLLPMHGGVAELAYAGDLKSSAFGIVGSSPTAPTMQEFVRTRSGPLFRVPRTDSNPRGRGAEGTAPAVTRRSARDAARRRSGARAAPAARGVPPPLPCSLLARSTAALRDPGTQRGLEPERARSRGDAEALPGAARETPRGVEAGRGRRQPHAGSHRPYHVLFWHGARPPSGTRARSGDSNPRARYPIPARSAPASTQSTVCRRKRPRPW